MMKVLCLIIECFLCGSLISQTNIYRIAGDPSGTSGYNGNGGPAILSQLTEPTEVSTDSAGNIYILHGAWVNTQVRMIDKPTGVISTVIGGGTKTTPASGDTATKLFFGYINGLASDRQGNIYFSDGAAIYRVNKQSNILSIIAGQVGVTGYGGDNGPATAALLNTCEALALDEIRNYLYVADASNNRIRKINLNTGIITTVVGTGTPGYSGDWGPAVSATIYYPNGLTVDTIGNIYFSDQNDVIRKVIYISGDIHPFAGCGSPAYTGNGSAGIFACFNFPQSLSINKQNTYLYVADTYNHAIRTIDLTNSNNIVYSIAGNGTSGYSGDNGPSTLAKLNHPFGVGVNNNGDVIIADSYNNVVREIVGASGIELPVNVLSGIVPNPADQQVTLNFSRDVHGIVNVINILGETIFKQVINGNTLKIDISSLINGSYFLSIESSHVCSAHKLIVQHP